MSRIGFILWIMAAVCLGALGITLLLLSVWIPFLWIPTGLAILFISGAFFSDRNLYIEFLAMKTTKKGLNMGTLILLVVALVAMINFLAVRNPKVWDLSTNKNHSLSQQSLSLLKQVNSELTAKFFYEKGTEESESGRREFTSLIQKYRDQNDLVKLEFIEVNESPAEVDKYGVKEGRGVVFLDYEGRNSRVDKVDEQEVTSALAKVLRKEEKSVYFITGHGELSFSDVNDLHGGYMAKQFLEGSRFKVSSLNLTENQIPQDATVLVIAGPDQAFLATEIEQIRNYLKKGGRLLIALSAGGGTGLAGILAEVGIDLKNNYIATTQQTPVGEAINPQATVANTFSVENPITKLFTSGQMVVFRLPQGLAKSAHPLEGLVYEDLVKTGANSLGFKDKSFTGDKEKGPFTIVMAVKGKFPGADEQAKPMNLVVVGNKDIFESQMLLQNLNRDLYMNTVSYLADEENLISIAPRNAEVTQMNITSAQAYVMFFGFLIPIPVIFFIISLVMWLKRRHA